MKLLIALITIYAVLLTGCPKADRSLREAREASARMQIQAIGIIKANTEAFKAGEIDVETFAALTHATGRLVDGIKFYRARLHEAEEIYKATKAAPPKNVLDALVLVFDQRVAGVVIDLVALLNVVTGPRVDEIKLIVAAIQLAIASARQLLSTLAEYQQEIRQTQERMAWLTQN